MENYKRLQKLGEGTYGIVYKAVDNKTGQIVAIKQIRLEQEEEGIPVTAIREIALMKNLNHTNIIPIFDVICNRTSLVIIQEFMDFDLRKYLETTRVGLPPPLLKSYAFQILCAVCYLHCNRIIHRDLKPQNMLINRQGLLKLCDFGLSRMFSLHSKQYTSEMVTLWYRPAELLLGAKEYDVSVDVWSAGCVIAEMCRSTPLFTGDSEIDQLYTIFNMLGTPNESTWPGVESLPNWDANFPVHKPRDLAAALGTNDYLLVDLLSQMLQINPMKRISAMKALSHPYFADLSPKIIEMCTPSGVTVEFPKI